MSADLTVDSVPTPLDNLRDMAQGLWSAEATRLRGCTCGGTDIGVGVMHEPTCGDPSADDVASLLVRAYQMGAAKAGAVICQEAERDEARALVERLRLDALDMVRVRAEHALLVSFAGQPLACGQCGAAVMRGYCCTECGADQTEKVR